MNIDAQNGNPWAKSKKEMKAYKERIDKDDYQPRSWEELNDIMKDAQRIIFCRKENKL